MKTLFLALLLSFSASAAETSPRLLVHLLDYVSLDYPGAVGENGKVLSADEYGEQKEFSRTVLEGARTLGPEVADAETLALLEKLVALVEAKGPPQEVSKTARSAQGRILKFSKIDIAPKRWPDLQEGRSLYAKSCVQCHGAEGRGDGPSAASLDPKPASFFSEKMNEASPLHAFNSIRLGVPGTGMASFPDLSDQQAWALAFYVISLRHQEAARVTGVPDNWDLPLPQVASSSDVQLRSSLSADTALSDVKLAKLRVRSLSGAGGTVYIKIARDRLREALAFAEAKDFGAASQAAIQAYLDGVEPVEPLLRARDSGFVSRVEQAMTGVRQALSERVDQASLRTRVRTAEAVLDDAIILLDKRETSPVFTFSVAAGIFLREGFEAILIIVTLLGVIRAIGSRPAALYVHAGWTSAVWVGVLLWVFSGWVVGLSTASREIMEGAISLFAVGVLLYFGFWLHRKVQIQRWREFLEAMARTAMEGKKLLGLTAVAFMAVFREAFETILFLRALALEPGVSHAALWAGVATSFVIILVLAVALVRFSVRIPIRQLFQLSSWIVWLLAFVLSGKAIHSFQESGLLSVTGISVPRIEWVGLYPTFETIAAQITVLALGGLLFYWGSRPSRLKAAQ